AAARDDLRVADARVRQRYRQRVGKAGADVQAAARQIEDRGPIAIDDGAAVSTAGGRGEGQQSGKRVAAVCRRGSRASEGDRHGGAQHGRGPKTLHESPLRATDSETASGVGAGRVEAERGVAQEVRVAKPENEGRLRPRSGRDLDGAAPRVVLLVR